MLNKHLYIAQHLKKELELLNIASAIENQQGMKSLKAEIKNLGDGGNSGLLELMVLPYEVESGQSLLQIYTTIAINIPETNMLKAHAALSRLNVSIPVGTVQIYEEFKQMYHKYSVILEPDWSQDTVLKVCRTAVVGCIKVLRLVYNEAIAICERAQEEKQEQKQKPAPIDVKDETGDAE